jgi:hypothetical protein
MRRQIELLRESQITVMRTKQQREKMIFSYSQVQQDSDGSDIDIGPVTATVYEPGDYPDCPKELMESLNFKLLETRESYQKKL